MKICSIICSFNSPNLTDRVYKELLKNEEHDIFILENSTSEDKMYKQGHVIDMGRENKGFGGMHDFIWKDPRFRQYDFVGIYNNDIFDIPKNFISTMKKYMQDDIGMISPATKKDGTGWPWMRRVHADGVREVRHVEDIVTFFNVKLFDTFCEYIPFHYHGVVDIDETYICKSRGYRTVVVDEVVIGHMLSGARKAAGVYEDFLSKLGHTLNEWHEKFPDLKKSYEKYMAGLGNQLAVIIPNYNHNHLLREAIESVIYSKINADIIVVDDHSDESPYELIKDLPIQFFRHDRNRGLAQTRNTGISNTFAKWILPLDADDTLIRDGINNLWENRDKGDVIYGNLLWSADNSRLKAKYSGNPDDFLGNNQIFGSSLYKRECWEAVNGYWEEHHEFYEDWDFWGRVAKKGFKFHYVDTDVYMYGGLPGGMCDRLGKNREYNANLTINHIKQS